MDKSEHHFSGLYQSLLCVNKQSGIAGWLGEGVH
jgi:hypothetical protein